MILGRSVSNPSLSLLGNTKVIWYTSRIFRFNIQRAYMSVGSFIDAGCSSKFVCLILLRTRTHASVVTQHSATTRMEKPTIS